MPRGRDRSPGPGPRFSGVKTPQNALRAGLAAGALAAVLTLTGCGSEPSAAPTASRTKTATSTSSATATTTSATATAPIAAADGVDYGLCASRSCEVAVSGPADIRFGGSVPGTLSITRVAPDEMDINVVLDNGGGGSGTLKPGCSSFAFGGGGGSGSFGGPNSDCAQPPPAQPGAVTLQMPAMAGGTAILRIVTG
jgi:hypothetical protein